MIDRESQVDRLVDAMGSTDDPRFFRAPGRVNLMGDHTDYNDGFALPMAIDRECVAAARPRDGSEVVIHSLDLGGVAVVDAAGTPDPPEAEPPWARLAAGVVEVLAERGREPVGVEVAVTSTIPIGAGLSSSAGFEVALASSLCAFGGPDLPITELAAACQEAEHRATGVPSGIMDQLTSLAGVEDHALLIDCRTRALMPVPLPGDLSVLVVDSGVSRALADTPYAARRAACEAAAERLGLPSLRDASPEQVSDDPVARHVVSESARARGTAWALAAGDRATLAELFAASQASLRDDFGASTPDLDALVERLAGAGALGARLTGAGWGGCVVAVVDTVEVDTVRAAVSEFDAWVCRAVDGASELEV